MMNEKDRRIDEFLKFFRDIMLQNPGYNLTESNVYHELIHLGVNDFNRDYNVEWMFNNWIQRFRNIPNIDVFVAENWKYFCQFINKKEEIYKQGGEALKLYIPLDANHLETGASMIFDFLSRNNIVHVSKIGKHIRFDNIVLRLKSEEDLNKVINFVKNNRYIQEGLIPASPFSYNKDGLAMVCDGSLSYNSTVANYIQLYLNEKKKYNRLNSVDANDFYNYIINYYNSAFVNGSYSENKIYDDFKDLSIDTTQRIKNLKEVTELIIKSHNINFSYEDYLNHYRKCVDSKTKDNKINQENNNVNAEQLLNMTNYIMHVMTYRLGNVFKAKDNIMEYMRTNDSKYLTREFDLRFKVHNSKYREDLLEYLKNNNINLSDYLNYVINNNMKDLVGGDKQQKLMFAISKTYEKYGVNQVISAIDRLIKQNTYNGFTNDYNARQSLMNSVSLNDVKFIIRNILGLGENVEQFDTNMLYEFFDINYNSKAIK